MSGQKAVGNFVWMHQDAIEPKNRKRNLSFFVFASTQKPRWSQNSAPVKD